MESKKFRGLIYFVLLLIIIQFLTLKIARDLNYASYLGKPWFFGVYTFDYFVRWIILRGWRVDASYRQMSLYLSAFFVLIFFVEYLFIFRNKKNKNEHTQGTARWSTDKEIKRMYGGNNGVVFAQLNTAEYTTKYVNYTPNYRIKKSAHLLRDDGNTHTFVSAPTRSGKGVGIIVPTLLNWTSSTIVLDIKGENFDLTSGWRSKFSKIIKWAPGKEDTFSFNPLNEIDIHSNDATKLIKQIVDIIINPTGELPKDPMWNNAATSLLTAVIRYLLESNYPKKTNFTEVMNFMFSDSENSKSFLEKIIENSEDQTTITLATEAVSASTNTFLSVLKTASSALNIFLDPLVEKATSHSNFSCDELMNGDVPISLYVVITPDDISRLSSLIRVFFTVVLGKLMTSIEEKKRRLLLLLDEFPAIGKMEQIEKGLAYFAGYGIKCLFISQSLNQLASVYGENNSLLDNCHLRIFYATNDEKTAQRINKLLGKSTIVKKNISKSGKRSSLLDTNMSESESEIGRDLMTVGEVLSMSEDEALVLTASKYPYRAKKIRYFCDDRFKHRIISPYKIDFSKIEEKDDYVEVSIDNFINHDYKEEEKQVIEFDDYEIDERVTDDELEEHLNDIEEEIKESEEETNLKKNDFNEDDIDDIYGGML